MTIWGWFIVYEYMLAVVTELLMGLNPLQNLAFNTSVAMALATMGMAVLARRRG